MIQFILMLFLAIHPFHVSVCEIKYMEKEKSAQITIKIFLDDMEFGLRKSLGKKVDIMKMKPNEIDALMKNYLEKNFAIVFDDKIKNAAFLGTEIEKESLWCYLECKNLKNLNKVWVENTLLQEVFDDQVNLINITKNKETKSTKLTSTKPFDILKF